MLVSEENWCNFSPQHPRLCVEGNSFLSCGGLSFVYQPPGGPAIPIPPLLHSPLLVLILGESLQEFCVKSAPSPLLLQQDLLLGGAVGIGKMLGVDTTRW